MRVYIASKYIKHKEINSKIYETLLLSNIPAFLPINIGIDACTFEEMYAVSEKCYQELEKCNILLVVCPFGKSVSCEIGYAISIKKKTGNMKIITLNFDSQNEAMILPYIDKNVNSVSELVDYLKDIKKQNSFII